MDRNHHPHHAPGHRPLRLSSLVTALACAGLAAGCGGGDDSLTVTGTAATGAALAGAAVDVKCVTGSGSATTGADGSYSVSISGGALPCVARVTPAAAGGTVLHGVSTASGSSARVNLTPLTQLIVAQLALGEPAVYFSGYGDSAAAALTASAVSGAQAAAVAKLKAGGVDFSAVADASGGPLAAKNGSNAGDGYDQLLDQMQAALSAGGSTLGALTTAYATEAAVTAGAAQSSGTASLPSELLLKPAAANCRALRSGAYSYITPVRNEALADQAGEFVLDAQALTATFGPNDVGTLTPSGECAYTLDNGSVQVYVAPSGISVWRYLDEGSYHVLIAVPKQSHTLAELAGDWNNLGMDLNGAKSAFVGVAGTIAITAAGAVTSKLECRNDATWSIKASDCIVPAGGGSSLRVNAAGGFDATDSGAGTVGARVFAFRAGNGELMLMHVGDDGSFAFHTRTRSNPMPAVGAGSVSWNLTIGQNLLATSAVSATANTTSSVDAAAGSYVRQAGTAGQNTMHPETVLINSPRGGYNNRLAATAVTNSAGGSENVSEWTLLTLRGMGMTPVMLPAGRTLVLSVTRP
jgi:hypothetical protein